MPNVLEPSKSSRAMCRSCRQPIAKGELRFGEETVNRFADPGAVALQWHHIACAAKKKPNQLAEVLAGYTEAFEGRAEIERLVAENAAKQKPGTYPYAERAATARSRCDGCREPIAKDELRIATPREPEPGSNMAPTPRYYHARCMEKSPELMGALRANSRGLADADFDEIAKVLEA